ncbi:hypothetical protein QAD02_012129 [Eretmocerus hayati]|uniref:Uncharacterized protein n=1 Tax=Eretmocerus hayati TaxID=131215 RepID=A0ACC2NZ03_9HYME|nr:hypothetical protein QAD02_012129 [Eretmocerus hayati]
MESLYSGVGPGEAVWLVFLSNANPLSGPGVEPAGRTEYHSLVRILWRSPQVGYGDNSGFVHICSGCLVTTQHVLTTAQCIKNRQPDHLKVNLFNGTDWSHPLSEFVASEKTYNDWAAENSEATSTSEFNDIAILTLRSNAAVSLLHGVSIRLPLRSGTHVEFAGWNVNSRMAPVKTYMEIMKASSCEARIRNLSKDPFKHFEPLGGLLCASSANRGAILDEIDQGAPVYARTTFVKIIVGISIQRSPFLGTDMSDPNQVNLVLFFKNFATFISAVTDNRVRYVC